MEIINSKILENLKGQLLISIESGITKNDLESSLEDAYLWATQVMNSQSYEEFEEIYENGLSYETYGFEARIISLGAAAGLLIKYGLEYDEYLKWANKQSKFIKPYLLGLIGISDSEGLQIAQKVDIDQVLNHKVDTSINILDEKPSEDEVAFYILGKYVTLDKNLIIYKEVNDLATDEAMNQMAVFERRYREEIQNFDEIMTKLPAIAADCIERAVVRDLRALKKYGLKKYDVAKFIEDNYDDFDYYKYFKSYEDACQEFARMEADSEYKRIIGKISAGQWSGGGLGFSGMVKGALMAKAMNVGNQAFHEVKGALQKSHDSAKIAGMKRRAFRKPEFREYFVLGFGECCDKISNGMLKLLRENQLLDGPHWGPDPDVITNIIERSTQVTQEEYRKWLFKMIQFNPYKDDVYEKIYVRFGSQQGELERMARFFGVNIRKLIDPINDEKLCDIRKLPQDTYDEARIKAEEFSKCVASNDLICAEDEENYYIFLAHKKHLEEALWDGNLAVASEYMAKGDSFAERLLFDYYYDLARKGTQPKITDGGNLKLFFDAMCYKNGVCSERDTERSECILKQLAQQGDLLAQIELSKDEQKEGSKEILLKGAKNYDYVAIDLLVDLGEDVCEDWMWYKSWLKKIKETTVTQIAPSDRFLNDRAEKKRRKEFYDSYGDVLRHFVAPSMENYYGVLRKKTLGEILEAALQGDVNAEEIYVEKLFSFIVDDEELWSRVARNLEILLAKYESPLLYNVLLRMLEHEYHPYRNNCAQQIHDICEANCEKGDTYALYKKYTYMSKEQYGFQRDKKTIQEGYFHLLRQGYMRAAYILAEAYEKGEYNCPKDKMISRSLYELIRNTQFIICDMGSETDTQKETELFLWQPDDLPKVPKYFFKKQRLDNNFYHELEKITEEDFVSQVEQASVEELKDNAELMAIKLTELAEKVTDKYVSLNQLCSMKRIVLGRIQSDKARNLMGRLLDQKVEERLSDTIALARSLHDIEKAKRDVKIGAVTIVIIGFLLSIFLFRKALIIAIILAVAGVFGDENRRKEKKAQAACRLLEQYKAAGYDIEF